MAHGAPPWGETWRVLAYTLALALAFVGLGRLQVALFNAAPVQRLLAGAGLLDGQSDARLEAEAEAVAAASREAMARAPAGHRQATLQLGLALGQVSQRIGLFALAPAPARERAWQLLAEQRAAADALAQQLGVAPAQPLRPSSLREFNELGARYEADDNGLAARLEQRLSPWHRHVYLLGVHVGIESARIDATQGEQSLPPAALIRRHAALAGIAPALWQPLAAAPGRETPAQVQQRYRTALQALAEALARQDAAQQR